jgi:transposase
MEDTTPRYAGIDWASAEHAVCLIDDAGGIIERFAVAHRAGDLGAMCRRLARAGVERVAIERPDGPVVDALMDAGLEVVVIPSRQVKALRERYGAAGNKDDAFDAYVLADCLRTDGARLRSLRPDTSATLTLRALVRARKDLVAHRVALANQLRAHLQIVFPGSVGLFATLDSPISLRFLTRFSSASSAAWLSERRLGAWLQANGYCGRRTAAELHQRLIEAPGGLLGEEGRARGAVTEALVAVLGQVREQIAALEARIAEALALHPDGALFQSLPRSGTVRAAALLAEIGDCRERFPTPESLACLAGAAPSTRASGKHRAVTFRWAADKKLRDALIDFAGDSRHANPWAADLYARARARGKTNPHAERILARSWCGVIWRCWQDRVPYDPAKHHALQRLQTAVGG